MIRGVLADDEDLVRMGLRVLIDREDDLAVVGEAASGYDALRVVRQARPDVLLLDVRMPKFDGLEVLRRVRQSADTPVILVTARADEDEVVRGLQLGADDYVTKPFSLRQLAARIRTVMRRARIEVAPPAPEIRAAGMVLELDSHMVRRDSRRIRLTPLEFRILQPLLLSVDRVVSSERLLEQAWGFQVGDSILLQAHISHIRKKLGLERGKPGYIEAVPRLGYILHS